MARIIIFGGQGYLGQNIISLLSENHNFLTLGRRKEKLFKDLSYTHLSINDANLRESLNEFSADYFIVSYYGNPSSKDISAYNNLKEIISGIYETFTAKPKLIFISTQLVYSTKSNRTIGSIIEPIDFYGRMCMKFEKEMQEWTCGNHLILRVPIVYGGKPNLNIGYNNIVSVFLNAAMRGKKLQVYGSGSQIRSFIHIEDFVLLVEKIISDNINVKLLDTCFNEHYSIRQLAELIALKFNTEYSIIDWPDTMNGEGMFDIIMDSTQAVSMVKNKWKLDIYLNSLND